MTDERSEIQQVLAGDRRALKKFVEKYQKLVSHIVFRMIPNDHDRQDICQNVFLKVHQNLASFRHESKLSTWIGRVAYNQCLNFLEKKKLPLFEDIAGEDSNVDMVMGDVRTPEETAEASDVSGRLRREIETLPPRYRTILTLYHLDELTYNEIADITKMPVGTVKNYLFRARRQLKDRLLAKYGPEEPWQ